VSRFLEKTRLKTILVLAVPIMLGMVSQNVLNLVDTAFVGRAGPEALAAVGLGGFANFLFVAFLQGMGVGVQAIAARRMGEGRKGELASGLNASLVIAVAIGVPALLVGWWLADDIFQLLNHDPKVVGIGADYLGARFLAIPAVAANFAFRGYWNGTNRSTCYLVTLLLMHAVNIVLDYGLIFGRLGLPELGAAGAGYATSIAIWVGTGIYVGMALSRSRAEGFLKRAGLTEALKRVVRLSLPSSFQQTFFAAGFVMFFTIAGKIGTDALAASSVLINLLLVCILPGLGLGLAGASLVGQALGRKNPEDARRWGLEVAVIGAVVMGVMGLVLALLPRLWLGVFIVDSPQTLELAVVPLQLLGFAMVLDGVGVVLLNVLAGAGDTMAALIMNVVAQWVLFLPLAWFLAVHLGWGMNALWAGMIGYRLLLGLMVWVRFRSGRWVEIEV